MGIYLNPGNEEFDRATKSKIYVDKTGMISFINQNLNTEHQNICVSRPRRFGKSIAANMLVAYYSKGCDSKSMFADYKIAQDESFEANLNKYKKAVRLGIYFFYDRYEIFFIICDIREFTFQFTRHFPS